MDKAQTKLIIDFDGTLFDTEAFRVEIFSLFKRMGYDDEQIQLTYQAECLSYLYSPLGQLKRLQLLKPSSQSLAEARFKNLYDNSYKYIFPDVIEFLKDMKFLNYELILLTLGDFEFQRVKIENSSINRYFDKIMYCDIQKWLYLPPVINKIDKFIFIDDRADTIDRIGKTFPNSFSIRIDRYRGAKIDLNYDSQIKVKNLEQASKLLS